MKIFAFVLFVVALSVTSSAHGQVDLSNDNLSSVGNLNRSVQAPGSSKLGLAKAAGPLSLALAKDSKGKNLTSTFGPHETVYLVCANVTVKKGDKVAVVWYVSNRNQKLTGTESAAPQDGVFSTSYNLPPGKSGLPAGNYHVDFALNGKVRESLKFAVK